MRNSEKIQRHLRYLERKVIIDILEEKFQAFDLPEQQIEANKVLAEQAPHWYYVVFGEELENNHFGVFQITAGIVRLCVSRQIQSIQEFEHANVFAAFLGELLCTWHGGVWIDPTEETNGFLGVRFPSGRICCPYQLVWNQVEKHPDLSYTILKFWNSLSKISAK
jgi:hypothetical protein